MTSDEFTPGEGAMRLIGDKYEYKRGDGSCILLPDGGFSSRDALLYNLAADVSRRCDEYGARQSSFTAGDLRLICRAALEREAEGAMIAVLANVGAKVTMLFSGRMPSEAQLLSAVQKLFALRRGSSWIIAHSFTDTSGASDAVYANKLYQLAENSSSHLLDYLVFRGADCYSVRDEYIDFWK